jgi:hypothetical protein
MEILVINLNTMFEIKGVDIVARVLEDNYLIIEEKAQEVAVLYRVTIDEDVVRLILVEKPTVH